MELRPKSEDEKHPRQRQIAGQNCALTGRDIGIARAVAIAFAKEGDDVAVVKREKHKDVNETQRLVVVPGSRRKLPRPSCFSRPTIRRT